MLKKIVTKDEWLDRMPKGNTKLLAMYSSISDCIVTDPTVMVLPVDDHMVHRGDGVFESLKCVDGSIYNMEDHMARLARSCEALGIKLALSVEELAGIIVETARASGAQNSLIRLLVSRGCGTMSVNPYECVESQFYIVVYHWKPACIINPPQPVSVALSEIPIKPGIFAQVKTCNYLPNVLMKKEAVDREVDFTVSLDESGMLGEGATENIGIVTADKRLFMPPPERVLAGTTAKRAMVFARALVQEGVLVEAEFKPITVEMARAASEIHIYGTTPNVTSVHLFEGEAVGNGGAYEVADRLFYMLKDEMIPASTRLTPVFEVS